MPAVMAGARETEWGQRAAAACPRGGLDWEGEMPDDKGGRVERDGGEGRKNNSDMNSTGLSLPSAALPLPTN